MEFGVLTAGRLSANGVVHDTRRLERSINHRYRYRMKTLALITASALALTTLPAHAHPHVWVTGSASFEIEQEKLTRVGMRWQFDAFFSQVLGADFDTNSDGIFDESETKNMKDQVFTSLKDFGYFTHLQTTETEGEVAFSEVDNFSVGIDDGELIFSFELVLAAPVDTNLESVGLSLYDPTIYVDIILDGEEPVTIAGAENLGCKIEYRQGNEINSQSYFMVPQEVWLNCADG